MGRADDMSYIGEYLQIANSGYFSSWDIYPAIHVIGASISVVSNLDAHIVSFIIPIIFSFIFIVGIYLFSRELFSNSDIRSLVLVSSFILYLGVYNFLNVPHALFFAFMPFYLCFFNKHIGVYNAPSFSIIFVLLTLLIPFTHPFIVFFLFVFFLFHMLAIVLPKSYTEALQIPKMKGTSFLLLAVSVIGWYVYNDTLVEYFRSSYVSFIIKITEPVFFETTEKLFKINFTFFDYVHLFTFFYGRFVIPTLVIFVSILYIYKYRKSIDPTILVKYQYLWIIYILFIILQIVLLFNPVISHQPDRIINLNFVVYAQIPLFACSLYLLFIKKSKSFTNILLVCGILLFLWSFSLFGCFDSPKVYRTNVALTHNEVYGMDWFYEVKGEAIVSVPLSQINRFRDVLGSSDKRENVNYLPDHFGYGNTSHNFADVNLELDESSYIIILTIDELLYQELPKHKIVGRYTKEDFGRFRNDVSVNKLYDSTNIEIFKSDL